jgi:uncharacterized membrane protein
VKKVDIYDVFILLGIILLGCGIWLIFKPLALIVLGAIFIFIGFIGAKREGVK